MMTLAGKRVLITGSSRGIGRAMALRLAECGADVAVHYVGNEREALTVRDAIIAMGRESCVVQSDLKEADCAEKIQAGLEAFGPIDILILNASVQHRKAWQEISMESFEEQVNCNFRASLLLIQKFTPHMMEKRWGRIITIGSVQERKPHPEMLVYSATKAAQTLMAQSLALQLGMYGITVNAVAPGVILTDRNANALDDKDYYNRVVSGIPLGICGVPEDCAGVVTLLCSDSGRYITGQNIYVDGGMGIR